MSLLSDHIRKESNQMIIAARYGDQIQRQFVEEMIYMSTFPLEEEYGKQKVMEIFAECVAAYELGIGCCYTLFEGKRPMAYGFVFDAFDTDDSAPHLHALSVYPSKIKQSYGSTLLADILDREMRTGLTLECTLGCAPFFEKSGFIARKEIINGSHISMFSNRAKYRPRFKLPKLDQKAYDRYFNLYKQTTDSLVTKRMIALS